MSKNSSNHFEIDMTHGPLLSKMLKFYFPLMLSNILQLLFNAADVIVCGRWAGSEALAAVGATSALVNLLTNLFIGLSIGANVMVAHFYGAEQDDELSDMVHTSMLTALISGVVLTIIGLMFSGPILTIMGTPADTLPLAKRYIKILFCGMTFMMLYNFGASILRAIGDTKRPMLYLLVSGVVNVILNLIFVILFDMSVSGVALATIISQGISAFLIVRCLFISDSIVKLELKKLKINTSKLVKMLSIGLPAGFQGMMFSISNVIIQSAINSFDTLAVAGSTAASNIEGFVYMSMNAFYQTSMSFTGQNIGAKRIDRVKKILIYSLICVAIIGLIMGNGAYLLAPKLLSLYSKDEVVINYGIIRLKYICTIYLFCGMMEVTVGVIRGMGYSIMPMIVSLTGACLFRIVYIFTYFQVNHTLETLYLSYLYSWILTTIMHLICYFIVMHLYKKKMKLQT